MLQSPTHPPREGPLLLTIRGRSPPRLGPPHRLPATPLQVRRTQPRSASTFNARCRRPLYPPMQRRRPRSTPGTPPPGPRPHSIVPGLSAARPSLPKVTTRGRLNRASEVTPWPPAAPRIFESSFPPPFFSPPCPSPFSSIPPFFSLPPLLPLFPSLFSSFSFLCSFVLDFGILLQLSAACSARRDSGEGSAPACLAAPWALVMIGNGL